MSARILFICGSLDVGKNGVGDYTRSLAGELSLLGVKSLLVATHDREVTVLTREDQQPDNGSLLPTVRIPRDGKDDRYGILSQTIRGFGPQLVSLQYVPYAYQLKGLPALFGKKIAECIGALPLEIMFHETWNLPVSLTDNPKDWAIYRLQEKFIGDMLERLRPAVVHTHLPTYAARVGRFVDEVTPLPLSTNIPVATPPGSQHVSGVFRIAFFSQLATSDNLLREIDSIHEWNTGRGVKTELVIIGGNQGKAQHLRDAARARLPDLPVAITGFVAATEVSHHLAGAHIGMTPVPVWALGKSGTVAAFLSHRLPVCAPEVGQDGNSFFSAEPRRYVMTAFDPTAYERAMQSIGGLAVRQFTPAAVAERFLNDVRPNLASVAE